MTATMIEDLAKTLKAALGGYDAGDGLILVGERHSDESLCDVARTVLTKMRSPTESMRRAGSVYFDLNDAEAAEAASIVYVDMIDAALTA